MKKLKKEWRELDLKFKILIIFAAMMWGRMIIDLFGLYILLALLVLIAIPRWGYLIIYFIYLWIADLFRKRD